MRHLVAPGAGPAADVVGREAELEAIAAALAPERLPACVVVDGEAGIGKTTVWAAAAERARSSGLRVLAAAPVEAEAKLAYAVLGDLAADVLDAVLPELPRPQRRALEVALLLEDAGAAAADERSVAAALLSGLRALAAGGPVLLAVDDVQWCDAASAGSIAYALRRLASEPVGLLVARRTSEPVPPPLGMDRPRPGTRIARVEIGPLSSGALHQVVRHRIGVPLARPVLRRVHEASGGNPFFALEMARALREVPLLDAGEPLPVSTDLHDLVRDRLAALPAATRDVLPLIAALAEPSLPLLEAAAGKGVAGAVEDGVASGVLQRDRREVRFSHPLLAAAAYASLRDSERAGLHRRLADFVDDPEQRAQHLAASTEEPDPALASEIEAGARRALGRGALVAATELFRAARRLTPLDRPSDVRRRALAEARCWTDGGDSSRGRDLLERLLVDAPAGPARAEVLQHLGHALLYGFDWRGGMRTLEQAIAEPGVTLPVRLSAQFDLMQGYMLVGDDVRSTLLHARRTAELAEQLGDVARLAAGLATQARAELQLGRPFPDDVAGRALQLEADLEWVSPMDRPSDYLAVADGWRDRLPQAAATLKRILHGLAERGEETAAVWTAGRLAQLECLMGDFAAARAHAAEGYDFCEQAGHPANGAVLAATLAFIHAHTGAEAEARERGAEALELAGAGSATPRWLAAAALGLLELSLGEPRAAREILDPAVEEARAAGISEPGAMRFVPDAIEARLGAGDAPAAVALLESYDALARRTGRISAQAASLRCRGLLGVAHGDPDGAIEVLEAALEMHAGLPLPLERARTLLALGTAQRHARHKRDARATLESARADLAQLGARAWLGRAEAELASIGGRVPTGDGLTPTEARIARIVAEGRSNREVAAELFLSPKTVESHLRNVFRKLGISSRAQVPAALKREG